MGCFLPSIHNNELYIYLYIRITLYSMTSVVSHINLFHLISSRIVNVLALHFVTQVDELLFEALVPRRMANMVSSMHMQVPFVKKNRRPICLSTIYMYI